MTVDTTPVSPHPSDPAIIRPPATRRQKRMNPVGHKVAIITGGSQASVRAWSRPTAGKAGGGSYRPHDEADRGP